MAPRFFKACLLNMKMLVAVVVLLFGDFAGVEKATADTVAEWVFSGVV